MGGRGSATRVSRVRLVRAWGPGTGSTACALAGRRCALWGWRKGVPGGDAFCCCEGRLKSGAPPPPTALRAGCRGPLPTCCGPGCVGVGALHWPHGSRALWGAARHGGGGGRLGSGASPSPLPGPAGHVLWVRVWVCAVCLVPVRCVPWCLVLPFACPSGAPLSGALLRCCARRVLAVPPSLRACLARLLATSCFFRGFVALYPFLYPLLARPPPGMHFFPASALVCVSVFLLTCFLGPGSRALFFPSCWVLRDRGRMGACGPSGGGSVRLLGNILVVVLLPMLAPLSLCSPSRGT